MDNANTREYLDKIRSQVVENLKRTAFAPSVQMTDVPRNPMVDGMDDDADDMMADLDEDENKDKRFTQRRFDQRTETAGELSDSEDEDEMAANGIRRQPGAIRRRNQVNYRNLEPDSGLDSGMATPQDASSAAEGDMDIAGLDAKMTDVPRTEPDGPSASLDALHAGETPMTDADHMAVEKEERDVSTASQRQSPPPHNEDITMEDAAIVGEPIPSEQVPAPVVIAETSVVEGSAKSPTRAQSPPKEGTNLNSEKGAGASTAAADIDAPATKEESLEHMTEPKKEE